MQINKEKSQNVKKMINLNSNSNLFLTNLNMSQRLYHSIQNDNNKKIANLSEKMYDKKYNDFCNNCSITILDKEHKIKNLYIEYGYIDNNKIVYVIDFHNPKINVITNKEIDNNYKRKGVMLLKYSDVFYEYYKNNDRKLEEYINLFEGKYNYNVPETYYYNPIFYSDNEKKNAIDKLN